MCSVDSCIDLKLFCGEVEANSKYTRCSLVLRFDLMYNY